MSPSSCASLAARWARLTSIWALSMAASPQAQLPEHGGVHGAGGRGLVAEDRLPELLDRRQLVGLRQQQAVLVALRHLLHDAVRGLSQQALGDEADPRAEQDRQLL